MATSLQERLKLKQYQVDTWTTREQLCLASAVLRSGDQNWVAVRRNIKMLTTEHSRPHDWYSTKNCALQYAKLLECVDTPKRKRERSDSYNETPGEIVTKTLTKRRIEELTKSATELKTSYNQLTQEIKDLEQGNLDNKLDEMWEEFLKERAEEEEEEQRHQQWLKEREQKITAIMQALKHQGPKVHIPPNKKKHKHPWPVTSVAIPRRNSGMSETSSEVDSALDSPDVQDPSSENANQEGGISMETPENKPTPTSPLLSSLLSKSPILSGSPSSQMRGIRPGFSSVSMALQNLVTSAISGTDSGTKSSTSPSSGSSTLSRLLDLPPSAPGGPLPRLSDLPTSSLEQKDVKSLIMPKEEKDKAYNQDGKRISSGISNDFLSDIKQEKADNKAAIEVVEKVEKAGGEGEEVVEKTEVKEETKEEIKEELSEFDKLAKSTPKKYIEADSTKEIKFRELDPKVEDKTAENVTVSTKSANIGNERSKSNSRDSKKKEDKRKDSTKDKEKKISSDIKEKKTSSDIKEKKTSSDIKEKKLFTSTDKKESGSSNLDVKEKSTKEAKEELPSDRDHKRKEKDGKRKESTKEKEKKSNSDKKEAIGEQETRRKDDRQKVLTKEKEKEKENEKKNEIHSKKDVVNENNESGSSSLLLSNVGTEKHKHSKDRDSKRKEDNRKESSKEKEKRLELDIKDEYAFDAVRLEIESRLDQKNSFDDDTDKLLKEIQARKLERSEKKDLDDFDPENSESKDWMSEEEGSISRSGKRKISSADFMGYSPLICESGPTSPASTHYGDDSESERLYKSWKKPIMILWNEIASHRFASIFLRPITDEQAPGYHTVVFRPLDLQTIKRSIESGMIRNTAEFQRDVMLMFMNAIMYNTSDHNVHQMAHQMMEDTIATIEEFLNTQLLARAEKTPRKSKSLRRETRESSAKRSDDDHKRKRDPTEEKPVKKLRR